MNGFLLDLQGPMMSFGDQGFGQLRDEGPAPSRSAVIGLLAAAIGLGRGDPRLLELHRRLRVHSAVVRPGELIVDYHTVLTAGYEDVDPALLQRKGVRGANPTLTRRRYHVDAHHVALIESDHDSLVRECSDALRAPHYCGFLGRRGCPPAIPLLPMDLVDSNPLVSLGVACATASERRGRVPAWRRHEKVETAEMWLDGRGAIEGVKPPAGWAWSVIGAGVRRDLLAELPRYYVNRPVTRVIVTLPRPETKPDNNAEFFDAAP